MADQSPQSMAEAAYAAAVAQMERQDETKRVRDDGVNSSKSNALDSQGEDIIHRPMKSFKPNDDGIFVTPSGRKSDLEIDSTAVGNHIEEIWKTGSDVEENFAATIHILIQEINSLMQCGLGAFHDLDATSRKLAQSKELAETRSREAQRLHSIDEQSRASLSVS